MRLVLKSEGITTNLEILQTSIQKPCILTYFTQNMVTIPKAEYEKLKQCETREKDLLIL